MQLAFDLQRSQMDNLFFVRSSHTCHAREMLLWSPCGVEVLQDR